MEQTPYNPFDDEMYDFMNADRKKIGVKAYADLRKKAVIYLNARHFTVQKIATMLNCSTGTVTGIRLKNNLTYSKEQLIAQKRNKDTTDLVTKTVPRVLTAADAEKIKQLIAGGKHTYIEIASMFGTVASQICFVKQNKFTFLT
jgi:transposase